MLVAGIAAEAFAQGSLTPPPGTPGPSMKTLAQVKPQIPIMNAPCTITQPGAYYLTTNLVTTSSGITISANDVTVDLMGFSITGDRGANDYGVFVDGKTNAPCRNIVVRNGTIKNFGNGLELRSAQHSLFEYLMVSGSVNMGIRLNGSYSGDCSGNRIANCRVSGNGYYGIFLFVNNDVGKCNGNSISDCTFRKNANSGVRIDTGSGGQCNQNAFRNCMIQDNASHGIHAWTHTGGRCCGNVIEGCNISGNAGYGIYFTGGEGNMVVGNRISLCTLYNNAGTGIKQEAYGVSASQINGNLVSGTRGTSSVGIDVPGQSPNLIVQNVCIGQTNNFFFGSGATYGAIVTAKGALSTTNGAAGLSPWANFSR